MQRGFARGSPINEFDVSYRLHDAPLVYHGCRRFVEEWALHVAG
jgi:hypothetical protein